MATATYVLPSFVLHSSIRNTTSTTFTASTTSSKALDWSIIRQHFRQPDGLDDFGSNFEEISKLGVQGRLAHSETKAKVEGEAINGDLGQNATSCYFVSLCSLAGRLVQTSPKGLSDQIQYLLKRDRGEKTSSKMQELGLGKSRPKEGESKGTFRRPRRIASEHTPILFAHERIGINEDTPEILPAPPTEDSTFSRRCSRTVSGGDSTITKTLGEIDQLNADTKGKHPWPVPRDKRRSDGFIVRRSTMLVKAQAWAAMAVAEIIRVLTPGTLRHCSLPGWRSSIEPSS
ncbi:hypothetical protein K402DRAFT_407348 [Aulographum hederae CBS 113979]|uniref:Uncharacterized protein n=1 Tax=Aulographum hederae CBS 113979 TaxID=1176131 RepID=A0A6G1GPK7_9PEZI|nr:hypothetical protein K402DRAFT_407348 [Aulographum hederae CBS 113979]